MIQTVKRKVLAVSVWVLLASFVSYGQDLNKRTVLGETYARKEIKQILHGNNYKPFYDTLIKDKETVIAVVEPMLFKIYGRENVVNERPYECYLIDGCWFVSGTLPKNTVGGTFEIIVDSRNGKVLKLIHGK